MKMSLARKQAFCEAMVRGQTPEVAARTVGVDRATAYRWRAADAAFAAAWEDARERKIEAVENILYRQAMAGEAWACIFFLKCHKPEIYNRRQVIALGGDLDNPLTIARTGEVGSNVHFYMPANHRDEPERDGDANAIEGQINGEGDDEAAA
jgi:hypothetical protein